jgi:hypothetical protein
MSRLNRTNFISKIEPLQKKEPDQITKGTESLIEDYHKRWRIKQAGDSFYNNSPNEDDYVQDEDRKIGETWQRNTDGKWVTKIGDGTYVVLKRSPEQEERHKSASKIKDTCPSCGRQMQSVNELRIFRAEGLCLECITENEIQAPQNSPKQEISEHDIIIKDHANRPVMTLAEFRQVYGNELADQIKKERGITLNTVTDEKELMYTPNVLQQIALQAHANAKEDSKPDF